MSSLLLSNLPAGFRLFSNAIVERRPAAHHALPEVVGNEAKRGMPERDQRSTVDFPEPVLQVRDDRHRHEQRSRDLEQCWPLDRLNVSPEVSVVVAEIAVPATTRSCLEHHRHRHATDARVVWAHLLQQRLERGVERSLDADLFREIECEIVERGYSHSVPPL